jgi:hypothetical protein
MPRGPHGARGPGGPARMRAPRSVAGSVASGGLIGTIEKVFAVMPPRIKLEIAERIGEWSEEKRRDAMDQLGLTDDAEPEPPAAPERETYTTTGEASRPRW